MRQGRLVTAPLAEPVQLPKGERTRQAILDVAAARASEIGLDALSLGGLADELEMSKSGLFAHFGSREELQLATIEHAREIFAAEVVAPVEGMPAGLEQLRALCDSWLSYVERGVFPGGCFFSTVTPEFSNRPGVVRDRLAELMDNWLERLERAIRAGRRRGEISPNESPKRLSFEIFSIGDAASRYYGILGPSALQTARDAINDRIDAARA
jgi:AcrR family transcriptional regulator